MSERLQKAMRKFGMEPGYVPMPVDSSLKDFGGKYAGVKEEIAREAYKEYADEGHGGQSFERLQERGGFDVTELIALLYCRCRRLETGQRSDLYTGGKAFLWPNRK